MYESRCRIARAIALAGLLSGALCAQFSTYLGKSVGYTSYHLKTGYSYRWNFDIQRQFAHNLLVEIGYEGNHGVHLGLNRNLAVLPAQYLSTSPLRDQTTIDFLTAAVANPFTGLAPGTNLNGSTIQRQQLPQAFPHFTGLTERGTPQGASYFELFQARIEKRFSHGFQLLANFLEDKLLERRSFLNAQDAMPEKRISSDDRPWRFVLSLNWDLPFGKRARHRIERGTGPQPYHRRLDAQCDSDDAARAAAFLGQRNLPGGRPASGYTQHLSGFRHDTLQS